MFQVVSSHMRCGWRVSLGIATLLLLGCGDVDERPAEWAFVSRVILAPNCATASCHSSAAAAAGLNLADPDAAYTSLMHQTAQYFVPEPPAQETEMCKAARGGTLCTTPRPLLQPCRPDESRLIHSLRARGAQRMPPDRPLPVADVELIEAWILAGAKRHVDDPYPNCSERDAGAPPAGDAL